MKKLLIAAAVAVSVAATGFAGGVGSTYSAPAATNKSSFYGELNVGWQYFPIVKFAGQSSEGVDHASGGFSGAIDAGYMMNSHLGLEAGFVMPFQKAKRKAGNVKVVKSMYNFYGAAKLAAQPVDKLSIYALAGLGYTHFKDSKDKSQGAFGFVGGAGMNYAFNDMLSVGVKYLNFMGNQNALDSKTLYPNSQYFLANVGVHFS